MTLRRSDLLITQVRRSTENQTSTTDTGVSDEEILQYFNDGQMNIQKFAANQFPSIFQEEELINAVQGQEAYSIPSDALLGNRVDLVEYSTDGQERNYRVLAQGNKLERISGIDSTPAFYIRRSGVILLQPAPDDASGLIRLTYQKRLPKIDVRRATIDSVTTSGSSITSLILDTTVEIQSTELLEDNRVTVVDREGVITMKNIPIDAIDDTGTGAVTVTARS